MSQNTFMNALKMGAPLAVLGLCLVWTGQWPSDAADPAMCSLECDQGAPLRDVRENTSSKVKPAVILPGTTVAPVVTGGGSTPAAGASSVTGAQPRVKPSPRTERSRPPVFNPRA